MLIKEGRAVHRRQRKTGVAAGNRRVRDRHREGWTCPAPEISACVVVGGGRRKGTKQKQSEKENGHVSLQQRLFIIETKITSLILRKRVPTRTVKCISLVHKIPMTVK